MDLTRWSMIWGALVVYIVLQKLFKSNKSKNSLDLPQKTLDALGFEVKISDLRYWFCDISV